MTRYYTGDPSVLRSMRFMGRGIFVVAVFTAVLSFILAALQIDILLNCVMAAVASIVAYVMAVLMRRYGFGLTWHNHVDRRDG